MPAKKPKSDYVIQTVINALRLLEAFDGEDELGVTELSRYLDLHKNNVFRLLATLEQHGYIEQSADNDRYRLGYRCLELGEAFCRSHALLDRARPVVRDLAAESGETAHLAVLSAYEVVHIDAEVFPQPILTGSRVGQRMPVHSTALGKVLLGCATDECRETYDRTIVAGRPLSQRTDVTIVDPLKFFEHIRTVAGQGFALDIEETEQGLNCAAAPVFDRSGAVVAAVSASGPSFRSGIDRLMREIVPLVTGSAGRISQRLGYRIN
ncbi:MAG: IclR family transcriptional regulator [Myxococcota bacterium]